MAKVMWRFKTKHFTVEWLIEKDPLDTSYMDRSLAQECREKVRSGEWKCFSSEIRVILNHSKLALGEAFLGNSIYAKPAEFRDHFGMNRKGHGSYFSQMVREAVSEARVRFARLQQESKQDVLRKQRALSKSQAINLRAQKCTAVISA